MDRVSFCVPVVSGSLLSFLYRVQTRSFDSMGISFKSAFLRFISSVPTTPPFSPSFNAILRSTFLSSPLHFLHRLSVVSPNVTEFILHLASLSSNPFPFILFLRCRHAFMINGAAYEYGANDVSTIRLRYFHLLACLLAVVRGARYSSRWPCMGILVSIENHGHCIIYPNNFSLRYVLRAESAKQQALVPPV